MSFFMRNESLSSGFIQPSRIKLIPRLCQDGPSIVCGYGWVGRSMNILENKPFSHWTNHNNHNNCLPYVGLCLLEESSPRDDLRYQVRVTASQPASVLQLIVGLNCLYSRPLLSSPHFVIFPLRRSAGLVIPPSHSPPHLNAACCCRQSGQGTMPGAWNLCVNSTNNSEELGK